MSTSVNIQNIKYIAPIAISRLYEQRQSFFMLTNSGASKTPPSFIQQMHERRIQSEKNMERIQKKMLASNSTNGFAYTQAVAAAAAAATAAEVAPTFQQKKHQKELQ